MSGGASSELLQEPVVCGAVSYPARIENQRYLPLFRGSSNGAKLKKSRIEAANSQGQARQQGTVYQQHDCKAQHSIPFAIVVCQERDLFLAVVEDCLR